MAKEKKVTQIHLRISEPDAALMRERAQAAGLGLSAYVRRCALAGGAPAPAADARELRPIYAELRRCGNNVNQVARALNTSASAAHRRPTWHAPWRSSSAPPRQLPMPSRPQGRNLPPWRVGVGV